MTKCLYARQKGIMVQEKEVQTPEITEKINRSEPKEEYWEETAIREILGMIAELNDGSFDAETQEELWGRICTVSGRIQEYLAEEHCGRANSFVTKAIRYVENHYSDQKISIEVICAQLGVSAAYFSTIFKKETGKTFIQYLTDYRMERAARLLLTTDEKTYIIAEKTGYADPNYFSIVFKKRYGLSPTKFRADHIWG